MIDLEGEALTDALGPELAVCALRTDLRRGLLVLLGALTRPGSLISRAEGMADLDVTSLALSRPVVDAAKHAHKEGRDVILLAGAHADLGRRLQQTHSWIDDVINVHADDGWHDLASVAAVRARCATGFLFLPSSAGALWARHGTILALDTPVAERASAWQLWCRAIRVHQWIKNILVIAPLILAGRIADPEAWLKAGAAFIAFALIASATYLINDLHDLAFDRTHHAKRHRPLASGALQIFPVCLAVIAGLALGLLAASQCGVRALAVAASYLALTLAYTFCLKRYAILDAATLAGLFTLRLIAGLVFCAVPGSSWMLALSMFLFTSLALAKRLVEIHALPGDDASAAGRGYIGRDGPMVLALGVSTSMGAIVIFSLYIVEAAARQPFYTCPALLWLAPGALFLWLGRVWLLCGRKTLHDDPVEFALHDRVSIGLGLVLAVSFALAALTGG